MYKTKRFTFTIFENTDDSFELYLKNSCFNFVYKTIVENLKIETLSSKNK